MLLFAQYPIFGGRLTADTEILADLPTLGLDVLNKPQPVVSENQHSTRDEGKVVAGLANKDLAKQNTIRVEDMHTIAAASPNIAVSVGVNTVREAVVAEGESTPVGQALVVDDVKSVNGAGAGVVASELLSAGIADVKSLVVRGEFETVALNKPVGNDLDNAGGGLEAVNLLGDDRRRAEVLEISIVWIRVISFSKENFFFPVQNYLPASVNHRSPVSACWRTSLIEEKLRPRKEVSRVVEVFVPGSTAISAEGCSKSPSSQ